MTPAIFPIRLRISTAYVILGARAVLVDTGSEGEEERILRGLRRYNVEPERVALLLHTHGHTDHAGSTRALKERLRIPAAVHTAGHTPGSISILFDDGRAIAGDLMMGGSLGGAYHATEPGYHYFAEDLTELRRSIRKLLDRGARTIYLGHGGPLDAGRARERFSPDFAGI